jgi:hypothetical protein
MPIIPAVENHQQQDDYRLVMCNNVFGVINKEFLDKHKKRVAAGDHLQGCGNTSNKNH